MIGTIAADGINPLDPVEASMIGDQRINSFEIAIFGYTGSFYVQDQNYTLDGSELIFPLNPIILTPANNDITFYYTVETVDGSAFPESLVEFDSSTLEFTVKSTD